MLDFKLPVVGENIKSGTVVNIFVKPGDSIKEGQDLLELETDKASLPIPSPVSGVIKEILISSGDEVKIGQLVMKIEEKSGVQSSESMEKPKVLQPSTVNHEPSTPSQTTKPKSTTTNFTAPLIRAVAQAFIPAQGDVPAAPSVRKLARELGINISQVPGTGPGGRISLDDVKAFTKQIVLSGGGAAPAPARVLPDFTKFGEISREGMSKIRKVTGEQMTYCWTTIPHVTQFDKTDITELEKLRKANSTEQLKLTVTPFLLKVIADALIKFPQFNASIDTQTNEIVYKKYIHIGVAVDTDRGLLVPKIRNVEKKSIMDIANELNEVAQRARDKKISLDDLQGGSITLTNLGGIGGTSFTPIVNWPEVAILGVSRGGFEPVYKEGQFVPRLMLPLSLSYDHRLIDGADGARFLRFICEEIQNIKKI